MLGFSLMHRIALFVFSDKDCNNFLTFFQELDKLDCFNTINGWMAKNFLQRNTDNRALRPKSDNV